MAISRATVRTALSAGGLLFCLVGGVSTTGQAEPAPEASGRGLHKTLEAWDHLEAQLQEARQNLKGAQRPSERRKWEQEIQALEAQQETLVDELAKLIGGLPPAVGNEQTPWLEEDLERKRPYQDAILENNADRRLPSSTSK